MQMYENSISRADWEAISKRIIISTEKPIPVDGIENEELGPMHRYIGDFMHARESMKGVKLASGCYFLGRAREILAEARGETREVEKRKIIHEVKAKRRTAHETRIAA
jgi:hypothetical protein